MAVADYGWLLADDRWLIWRIAGCQVCKLVIRPDACAPPSARAPDVGAFADYAEKNAIVLLHPCLGGPVNRSRFPSAHDVEVRRPAQK